MQRPRNDNWEHVDYSEHDDRTQSIPVSLYQGHHYGEVEQLTDPPRGAGPEYPICTAQHNPEHQWNEDHTGDSEIQICLCDICDGSTLSVVRPRSSGHRDDMIHEAWLVRPQESGNRKCQESQIR